MSFVPFWAYTRDKDELSSDFYNRYLDEDNPIEVAPGLYGIHSLQDSVWQWIIDSNVRKAQGNFSSWKPRHRYRYSDLGFFILKRMVERIVNQPMDVFLEQNFYAPLGLSTLTYLPLCKFPVERIPPTAEDDFFRRTLVHGTVHDEGAALMGGIAGHAGLFSNANDLAILMQMNLQDGKYGGQLYFQEGTIARFAKRQFNDNRRGLGWDKPEIKGDGGATAPEASSLTFGHLGFTGTAVWADPQYDLVFVFLSNRIHPNARNTKLLTDGIRTKIHSIIYRAMMDYHTTLVE
jgi:CubicO group peptidase (beta-lactamase class C family)